MTQYLQNQWEDTNDLQTLVSTDVKSKKYIVQECGGDGFCASLEEETRKLLKMLEKHCLTKDFEFKI